MKLTPPESFNYKAATLSLASALNACRNDWRQKIQLRGLADKGKSYLCTRQPCNTRAQGSGKNPGTQTRRIMTSGDKGQKKREPREMGSEEGLHMLQVHGELAAPGANLLLQESIIRTKTLIWED